MKKRYMIPLIILSIFGAFIIIGITAVAVVTVLDEPQPVREADERTLQEPQTAQEADQRMPDEPQAAQEVDQRTPDEPQPVREARPYEDEVQFVISEMEAMVEFMCSIDHDDPANIEYMRNKGIEENMLERAENVNLLMAELSQDEEAMLTMVEEARRIKQLENQYQNCMTGMNSDLEAPVPEARPYEDEVQFVISEMEAMVEFVCSINPDDSDNLEYLRNKVIDENILERAENVNLLMAELSRDEEAMLTMVEEARRIKQLENQYQSCMVRMNSNLGSSVPDARSYEDKVEYLISEMEAIVEFMCGIDPDDPANLEYMINKGIGKNMLERAENVKVLMDELSQDEEAMLTLLEEIRRIKQLENQYQNCMTRMNSGGGASDIPGAPPGAGPLGEEHAHAAILVRILGDTFDFGQSPYQIQSSWIHFEGQDGTTVHRHASGVTLGYLFESMDIGLDDQCYIFPNEREFCTNDGHSLKFYINGQQVSDIRDYVVADQDRILISYGNESEAEIQGQLQDLNSQIILG